MKLQFRAAWMLEWLSFTALTGWLTDWLSNCLSVLNRAELSWADWLAAWLLGWKPLHHLQIKIKMNYETSQDAVTGQETDYQLSSSQLNLTSPFSPLPAVLQNGSRAKIQNWCEFHKSVSGSALINDSLLGLKARISTHILMLYDVNVQESQSQSVKPTGNSQQPTASSLCHVAGRGRRREVSCERVTFCTGMKPWHLWHGKYYKQCVKWEKYYATTLPERWEETGRDNQCSTESFSVAFKL